MAPYETVPVNACSLAQRNTPRILLCGFRNHLEDAGPLFHFFFRGDSFPKHSSTPCKKKKKKEKKKAERKPCLLPFLKLYRLKFLLTPLQKGKKEIRILRTVLAGGRRGPSRALAAQTCSIPVSAAPSGLCDGDFSGGGVSAFGGVPCCRGWG